MMSDEYINLNDIKYSIFFESGYVATMIVCCSLSAGADRTLVRSVRYSAFSKILY